jgi:hypothetical protein
VQSLISALEEINGFAIADPVFRPVVVIPPGIADDLI